MREAICSVSIDLDSVSCYEQIHGLANSEKREPDPIYTIAMPRFLELFDHWNVRATFFVVGQDTEHSVHADILKEAVKRGHELANHTYSHPYGLTRLSMDDLEAEIVRGGDAISSLLPDERHVQGFRCPGYHISPAVLEVLRREGYLYDSSIFPCPPYIMARAAMIGWIALRGRESRSMAGSVETLWTPSHPYHPGFNPHRKGQIDDLWEIPMSVVPGIRFPYIGTFVYLYPKAALGWLTRRVAKAHPLLNFEWHGVDILDSNDPGLSTIIPHQHDLRVPLDEKMERLTICLRNIAKSHSFKPLCDAVCTL